MWSSNQKIVIRLLDHAVWRFCLRQLKTYLKEHAHESYLDGLDQTGITIERIPQIQEISTKLSQFGWRAVAVSGFLPPTVFMEMQSLRYLPIASDMRILEHLAYTPAPDIVHEAAGHAPLLANPEYADYLGKYAQVANKALLNQKDFALYKAIRKLSDMKEHPQSTPDAIQKCEKELAEVAAMKKPPSEASLLARMNWWTAEYGLIGDMKSPKIYGAGLLSSVAESKGVPNTKKLPFSIECVQYAYDITEPQPQLFVAQDFTHLRAVLKDLASQMAQNRGGEYGLQQAKQAGTVCTVQLNTGLQISGVLHNYFWSENEGYLQFMGPTQLSQNDDVLNEHTTARHPEGFGGPIGVIPQNVSWQVGEKVDFTYRSGVNVQGHVIKEQKDTTGQVILITLDNAHVEGFEQTLFAPEWGEYDLIVGDHIVSVFGGAADSAAFGDVGGFAPTQVPPKTYTDTYWERNALYKKVRHLREIAIKEKGSPQQEKWKNTEELSQNLEWVLIELDKKLPKEWLLRLELLELSCAMQISPSWQKPLRECLESMLQTHPQKESIAEGLALHGQLHI